MASIDGTIFLWINGWIGTFPVLDDVVNVIVSDYLVPVALSVAMIGLWFVGKTPEMRERYQKAVFVGMSSIGVSNLIVMVINQFYFRPRPFNEYDVSLLFYRPTDSSFPANPAAMAFAVAIAVWMVNRRFGWVLIAVAAVFFLSRVYAGVFYPSDVVAGALIGIAVSLVLAQVRRLIEPLPTLVIRLMRALCLA